MAGSAIFDAEAQKSPKKGKGDDVDDLQQSITEHLDMEHNTRMLQEDKVKVLQQLIIQRKSAEAALFSTNAQTLRLRARAQQLEARVARLANELRRVYQNLPEVVRQRLKQSTSSQVQQKECELVALKSEHRKEHFKYWRGKDLTSEIDSCDVRILTMNENTASAANALNCDNIAFSTSMSQIQIIHSVLVAQQEAWTQLANDAPNDGRLCIVGIPEEAENILQQAALAAATVDELITIVRNSSTFTE